MLTTNRVTQILSKVFFWLTLVMVFVLGFFALPITSNFLGISKLYLGFSFALITLFFYGLTIIARKRVELTLSPLTWSLILFAVVVGLSVFFTTNYPAANLIGLGGVFLSFVLVALIGGSILPKKPKYATVFNWSIIILGVVTTILGFLTLIGYGPERLFNAWFSLNLLTKSLVFNLTGSPLIALQIVILASVAAVLKLKDTLRSSQKMVSGPLAYVISLSILALGLGLYAWALLPGKSSSLDLQPPMAGWSVALDVMRVPRNALIGVGPEDYVNAYQRYKPLWMNGTKSWGIAYIQSSIPALTIMTTLGVIGLIAWLILFVKGFKLAFAKTTQAEKETKNLAILIAVGFLMQLLFPVNVVILTLVAILIAFYTTFQKTDTNTMVLEPLIVFSRDQKFLDRRRWPQILIGLTLVVISLGVGLLLGRSYVTFYYFNQANKALAKNDAVKAYQYMTRATTLNPYMDVIRRQRAMLNLALATALANKAEPTDDDKQQIANLLQQATTEAKAATILDPNDWMNWYTLAQVYQKMIGAAKDADQWAVQSYIKAIENNPTDPGLRISLGGIFLGQKDYQQAANIFRQAINVKPDYPNSYYNLAVALREAGDYKGAKQAYNTLLKLLKPDSEDYIKASKELKDLEEMMKKTEKTNKQGEQTEETNTETHAPSIIDQNLQNLNSGVKQPENSDTIDNAPVPLPTSETETPVETSAE